MNEWPYTYNVKPNNDQKAFKSICKLIERHFSNATKEQLLIDVDGSTIQNYYYLGKKIRVLDDYDVGAVWVDSEVDLSGVANFTSL